MGTCRFTAKAALKIYFVAFLSFLGRRRSFLLLNGWWCHVTLGCLCIFHKGERGRRKNFFVVRCLWKRKRKKINKTNLKRGEERLKWMKQSKREREKKEHFYEHLTQAIKHLVNIPQRQHPRPPFSGSESPKQKARSVFNHLTQSERNTETLIWNISIKEPTVPCRKSSIASFLAFSEKTCREKKTFIMCLMFFTLNRRVETK